MQGAIGLYRPLHHVKDLLRVHQLLVLAHLWTIKKRP